MHPVLAERNRLALYLAAWLMLGVPLALLAVEPGRLGFGAATLLTFPPTLVYAFVCLSAWYPVRAMPLRTSRAATLLTTHLLAAVVLSGAWQAGFRLWARAVDSLTGNRTAGETIAERFGLFFVAGALLYLLAVAFHYLLQEVEQSRAMENREMQVRIQAREAELKALKAQLDPHFLFNSLNSISALCGSSPASARTLTTLLAEYLRKSLRVGTADSITLSEELEMAASYLAVERIRFGPRLEFAQEIEESVRGCRVPPLLLQPLVENAIRHGIGERREGGLVRIAAARDGDRVRITVENECDPDRVPRPGEGIGLRNTRQRVEAFYGDAATLQVSGDERHFLVTLSIPESGSLRPSNPSPGSSS